MAATSATTAPQEPPAHLMRRAIAASAIGNATEWFDYGIYAYGVSYIAAALFPGSTAEATLFALATFAISFLVRPLGGLFWGPLGDRLGRKSVLAWMFQVSIDDMEVHLKALEERGFIGRIGEGDDQIIGLTAAGRSAHADSVSGMAPEIEPLMSEFRDEDLQKTVDVLQEIRRVFDNLPERMAS